MPEMKPTAAQVAKARVLATCDYNAAAIATALAAKSAKADERAEAVVKAAEQFLTDTCPVCGEGAPENTLHRLHCRARPLAAALTKYQETADA